jgi:hypothetical protein
MPAVLEPLKQGTTAAVSTSVKVDSVVKSRVDAVEPFDARYIPSWNPSFSSYFTKLRLLTLLP